MRSEGTVIYRDGSKYEGPFKDDKRDGNGVYYFAKNLKRYEGPFVND